MRFSRQSLHKTTKTQANTTINAFPLKLCSIAGSKLIILNLMTDMQLHLDPHCS